MKTLQTCVETIKNLVLIGIIVYTFFIARTAIKTVFSQITNQQRYVKSFEANSKGSVKVELENARTSLEQAVTAQSRTEGKQDQPVPASAEKILSALKQTNEAINATPESKSMDKSLDEIKPETWVYLGIERNGTWRPNFFRLSGKPTKGEAIIADSDVFRRDSKPVYVEAINDWKLGKPIGVLHKGQSAVIAELNQIESDDGGTIWWAKSQ